MKIITKLNEIIKFFDSYVIKVDIIIGEVVVIYDDFYNPFSLPLSFKIKLIRNYFISRTINLQYKLVIR